MKLKFLYKSNINISSNRPREIIKEPIAENVRDTTFYKERITKMLTFLKYFNLDSYNHKVY